MIINVPGHYETLGIDQIATIVQTEPQKPLVEGDAVVEEDKIVKYQFIQTAFCTSDPFIVNISNTKDNVYKDNFYNAIHKSGASVKEHNSLIAGFKAAAQIRTERQSSTFNQLNDIQEREKEQQLQMAYNVKISKANLNPDVMTIILGLFADDAKLKAQNVVKPPVLTVPMAIKPGTVITTVTDQQLADMKMTREEYNKTIGRPVPTTAPRAPVPITVIHPMPITNHIVNDLPPAYNTRSHITDDKLKEMGMTRDEWNRMNPSVVLPVRMPPAPTSFVSDDILRQIENDTPPISDSALAEMGMTREAYNQMVVSPVRGVPGTRLVTPAKIQTIPIAQTPTKPIKNTPPGVVAVPMPTMAPKNTAPSVVSVPMPTTVKKGILKLDPLPPTTTINPGTPLAQPPKSAMGLSNSPMVDITNAYTTGNK